MFGFVTFWDSFYFVKFECGGMLASFLWKRLIFLIYSSWTFSWVFCRGFIVIYVMVTGRGDGLRTLCHSCRFACAKNFSWPLLSPLRGWGSLTMAFLDYLATLQSQYLMEIGRDDSLSTLCHSCRFACQQRVLKTFPGPCYLCPEDGVVWLWHLLVKLDIYIYFCFVCLFVCFFVVLWFFSYIG